LKVSKARVNKAERTVFTSPLCATIAGNKSNRNQSHLQNNGATRVAAASWMCF